LQSSVTAWFARSTAITSIYWAADAAGGFLWPPLRAAFALRQIMGIKINQKAYAQTMINAEPVGCAMEADMYWRAIS
jgi:hypothetical protein